jgi:putative SOS response-associated peptidase YedK
MCGRFSYTVELNTFKNHLLSEYGIKDVNNDIILPRYNIAPGQDVIAIINDGKNYRVGTLKWGFVPSFAKDEKIGYHMINARSETLKEKPAYMHALTSKRCIILANGYYEWKKDGTSKSPMRIIKKKEEILPLAGLWSTYVRPDGSKLYTCTVITTSANPLIKSVHDRMPCILTEENKKNWLNPKITNPDILLSYLHPYNDLEMEVYPVSPTVNNAKNETIDCIKRI